MKNGLKIHSIYFSLLLLLLLYCTACDKNVVNIEENSKGTIGENSEGINEKNNIKVSNDLISLSEIWMYGKQLSPFWNEQRSKEWDKLYEKSLNRLLMHVEGATGASGSNQYETYEVFEEFISFLEDGHATITPSQGQADDIGFIPYYFSYYDGKYYVTSKSVDAEIPLGGEVIEIEGTPVGEYVLKLDNKIGLKTKGAYENSAIQRISFGKLKSSINVAFIDKETEKVKTVELTYDTEYGKVRDRKLEMLQYNYFNVQPLYSSPNYWMTPFDSTIYLWIGNFVDNNMVMEFYNNVLPIINTYDNLVIDVRSNGGGNADNGKLILELLSGIKVEEGKAFAQYNNVYDIAVASYGKLGKVESNDFIEGYKMITNSNVVDATELGIIKTYEEVTLSSLGIDYFTIFKGKIGIITSYRTASAAEDFTMYAKQLEQCKIYGTNTKGTTGQTACFELKNKMSFVLSILDYRTNEGNKIQNVGIESDFYVEQDMESFIKGMNNQLDFVIKNMSGE